MDIYFPSISICLLWQKHDFRGQYCISCHVSHALLSLLWVTECPTLTALLCQPFPSSVTPVWMHRGQNCMHCSTQHYYRLFGSIITGSFCRLFAASAQQIFIFFTVSGNWDGVSMDMCIVTQRSHLWKTVAADLETHHWTGKTRIAFSLMHSFTFAYIKISSFTQLLYLVRSFFSHEEALVLTTLNNLLSSEYLVTSLFTHFSISLMNMLNSTGQNTNPAGFHSWLLSIHS